MSLSDVDKEIILSHALAAAWSDGSFCDSERRVFEYIMGHIGLSEAEAKGWLTKASEPLTIEDSPIPKEPVARLESLRYAMAVTFADGSLEDSELQFLSRLAQHQGIHPRVLGLLCAEAESLVEKKGAINADALLQRVDALLPPS